MYLQNNQLSGSIPAELGDFPSLYQIRINNNQLSGNIPPELGNLHYINYFYLASNSYASRTCIPGRLQRVRYNDFADTGLPFCTDPIIDGDDPITLEVAENTAPDTSIGTTFEQINPAASSVTWSTSGSDGKSFTIDADSGQLQTKDPLDYETKTQYVFTVVATNTDSEADAVSVTINVIDVDEAPVALDDTGTTAENVAVTVDVLANDSDPEGRPLTVTSVTEPTHGVANIQVDSTVTYTPNTDYDGADSFTYTASDGSLTATATVEITISGDNQPPAFPSDGGSTDATRSVSENSPVGANVGAPVLAHDPEARALTYSLVGTDASDFEIESSTGQIKTRSNLDFETKSSYSVDVQVTDGADAGGNPDTAVDATVAVAISVTNEDEAGTITFSEPRPRIGVALTATLADPDKNPANMTWQWAASTDGSSNWNDVADTNRAAHTPTADEAGTYLRATVSYDDDHGAGKTAFGITPDPVNHDPVATDDTINVMEDESITTDVVGNDTDADAGDTRTIVAVGAPTHGSAVIKSGSTTEVTDTPGANFNGSDSFTYTVSDGFSNDLATVRVTVTAVDDTPGFPASETGTRSVAEDSAVGSSIGAPMAAVDPDTGDPTPDTLTYSLEGPDAGSFSIDSASGQIKVKDPLDYEAKASYSVTVKVVDSTSSQASKNVTMFLTSTQGAPFRSKYPSII